MPQELKDIERYGDHRCMKDKSESFCHNLVYSMNERVITKSLSSEKMRYGRYKHHQGKLRVFVHLSCLSQLNRDIFPQIQQRLGQYHEDFEKNQLIKSYHNGKTVHYILKIKIDIENLELSLFLSMYLLCIFSIKLSSTSLMSFLGTQNPDLALFSDRSRHSQ